MTEIFRPTLVNLTQDRVLDRQDLAKLRQAADTARQSAPGSPDAQVADQTLRFLDSQKSEINLRMQVPEGAAQRTLEFVYTPAYSESDPVPGYNPREQVANLSQADNLSETTSDSDRCGAASLLSAHLLLGGSFSEAAQRLGLPYDQRSFTFGNAHRAQHKLYQLANTDGTPGLNSAYSYGAERGTGRIVSTTGDGEIAQAASALNMATQPLLGSTTATIHQRHNQVSDFWSAHPQGVLQVGVTLDTQTGNVRPPTDQPGDQNHYVLVYRHQGQYVMVDSGQRSNGTGTAAKPLSQADYARFVLSNPGSVTGLWRK